VCAYNNYIKITIPSLPYVRSNVIEWLIEVILFTPVAKSYVGVGSIEYFVFEIRYRMRDRLELYEMQELRKCRTCQTSFA